MVSIGLLLILGSAWTACAQRPQDNWYLEQTWIKTNAVANGGLVSPYGVAIGPDQRVYVGDQGSSPRIQVYLPDGTFSFGITNGFGGGQGFISPRGIITDSAGNLFVADYGTNCVYVFTKDGAFIRRIGSGTGSDDGQLSGPIDAAISPSGEVYILENVNCRVSVFRQDGTFIRKWAGPKLSGSAPLDGQLTNPTSIAVAPDEHVYVCSCEAADPYAPAASMKTFDRNGMWIRTTNTLWVRGWCVMAGTSVRTDPGGYTHVPRSFLGFTGSGGGFDHSPNVQVTDTDGGVLTTYAPAEIPAFYDVTSVRHAIGPDGTTILCHMTARELFVFRPSYREQWVPPRNVIPVPMATSVQQRSNSQLVDIDYQVTDMDDSKVYTAALIFKNGAQAISNCIRNLTLVEGTATNLGPAISANHSHRLTWNSGADWSTSLAGYRVAILAKDSRTNLLDVHYLHLPAGNGMPALTISRSPLIQSDFMQVWWWLLATGDSTIGLSSNRIVGVGGAYDTQTLCDNGTTTTNGRSFIYGKMTVREATASEVQWSRQAATFGSVEQWAPTRSVGGRPAAVNEYGFDTGNWTNAWWIVPQN